MVSVFARFRTVDFFSTSTAAVVPLATRRRRRHSGPGTIAGPLERTGKWADRSQDPVQMSARMVQPASGRDNASAYDIWQVGDNGVAARMQTITFTP
jgi:hypothetical protein